MTMWAFGFVTGISFTLLAVFLAAIIAQRRQK